MKTAVYSAKKFEIKAIEKANSKYNQELKFIESSLSETTLSKSEKCKAISAFSNDNLSADNLEKLYQQGLRYITLRSKGYDHIDLKKANELGFRVAYVPEYSPYSIAEHSVALMLALNRKLRLADQRMRDYNFELDPLIGFDMHGKTAGIIGTGNIGAIVAKILNGFGCKLLGFDPKPNDKLVEQFDIKYVEMDELLQHSDIISIHCPLNDETRYLMDEKAFSKMKPDTMLINTSRGAVINTEDALAALDNRQLSALGLDVYEKEKGVFFFDRSDNPPEDPLFKKLLDHQKVLMTGHQAFLTQEALQDIAEATLYNLSCFEKDKACENELFSD